MTIGEALERAEQLRPNCRIETETRVQWLREADALLRTKLFDRAARKWGIDYAFYKTGPDKYLLFFKSSQADAMTACFSEYSRMVLNKAKSNRLPIREQLKQAAEALARQPVREKERSKEVGHGDR